MSTSLLSNSTARALAAALIAACTAGASAQTVVYDMPSNNGFFTPFTSANANSGIKYGDSGWIGSGIPPVPLSSLILHLATFGGSTNGSTDLKITVNDGDPSGLVFGTGSLLYSTTITGVALTATGTTGFANYFDVTVPLPSVYTLGGFNNVGFSLQCQNFTFGGQFGFQASTGSGATGFYVNNSSYYNGTTWSLFSFGGPAILAATFTTPAPGSASLLALGGLVAVRRRRR